VLISNIYLHYALNLWVEKVVKPRLRVEVYYVRYVDDFVLGFQHKEDALRFERVLKKRLEKFSLTLEPTKTQLVEFGRFSDRNMKQKGGRPKTLYFLGFTFYCSKNRNGRFISRDDYGENASQTWLPESETVTEEEQAFTVKAADVRCQLL